MRVQETTYNQFLNRSLGSALNHRYWWSVYKAFENLSACALNETEVLWKRWLADGSLRKEQKTLRAYHHFIKKFINENKVSANGFLRNDTAIIFEDLI